MGAPRGCCERPRSSCRRPAAGSRRRGAGSPRRARRDARQERVQPLDVAGRQARSPIEFSSSRCARCRATLDLREELDQLRVHRRVVGADRLEPRSARTRGSGPSAARRSGTSGPTCTASAGCGSRWRPCSTYARADGRRALGPQRQRPPARGRRRCTSPSARRPSPAPDVRAKSSVSSNVGVSDEAVAVSVRESIGAVEHRAGASGWSAGRTSSVPRGAWIFTVRAPGARRGTGSSRARARASSPGPWPG